MNLQLYEDMQVKIVLKTGQVYEGVALDYTTAEDNAPLPECIYIGDTELYEQEIESIEIVE